MGLRDKSIVPMKILRKISQLSWWKNSLWYTEKGSYFFIRMLAQAWGYFKWERPLKPREENGKHKASPAAELRAGLWSRNGMAGQGGRAGSGRARRGSRLHWPRRRSHTGGRVPHVGPVWCGQELRRWATKVLNGGRSVDSRRLIEPRGLSPRTGARGVQVI